MALIPYRSHRKPAEYPLSLIGSNWDQLFQNFFDDFDSGTKSTHNLLPRTNVSEDDKEIKLSFEIPGYDEKDIDLAFTKGILTVTGKKDETNTDEKTTHREFSHGSFERQVKIVSKVDGQKISAKINNGILKIVLPKVEDPKDKVHKIEVESQ